MSIQKTELLSLGLSDKEALLYHACLTLGPSKAKSLITFTDINRGTLYDIARSLFRKGLLSTTQKRGVTYFVPQSPNKLLNSLEEQILSIQNLSPLIEEHLHTKTYEPRLRYFEGKDGIQAIFSETLDCKGKEILQFVSVREMVTTLGIDFIKGYVRQRVRRHIAIRALKDPLGEISAQELSGHSTESDASKLMQTRISTNSISFPSILMIFDNSLAFISSEKENFGFILESPLYTTMMKQFFELAWKASVNK